MCFPSTFPKLLLWQWEIRVFVCQWPAMDQAPSMTFELNQVISDPWLIKSLESRTRKTSRTQNLDAKSQRFPDFQCKPLHLGNTEALQSHTFRTRTRMVHSSRNDA